MDLFLALLFLIGVGIAAVTAILVGTFTNLGESIIAVWRDHLGYRHTERMARMEIRQRARPVSASRGATAYRPSGECVRIVNNSVFVIGLAGEFVKLEPDTATRWLQHAVRWERDAGFDEAARAWIVRHPTMAQLPSADRRVTVRK